MRSRFPLFVTEAFLEDYRLQLSFFDSCRSRAALASSCPPGTFGSRPRGTVGSRNAEHLQFGSVRCFVSGLSPRRHGAKAPRIRPTRKEIVERLWQEFFVNPSEWCDARAEKVNPRYPDFKQKRTEQALWLTDDSKPPWVDEQLAALAPGSLQVDNFSWNKRLQRSTKSGDYKKTLEIFEQMLRDGAKPDRFTFVPVLKAVSNLRALEEGVRIHLQIVRAGYGSDAYIASGLVDMYCKCKKIEQARRVFDQMPVRDAVIWSTMILGYVRCRQAQKALEIFRQMQEERVHPDPVIFVGVLNACASLAALGEGRLVHKQILEKGYDSNVFVANSLVDMYAKCGSIEDARTVFNAIPAKVVASWNAMIGGYVKCGEGLKALELSHEMQLEQVDPDRMTFMGLLNACASVAALTEGRHIHEQIITKGYKFDVFLGSCLIDMYAKCASIEDACTVFQTMPTRDVVSWNAMIGGYVKCGEGQKALELYRQMQQEQVDPDLVTFVGLLNACASMGGLEEGRRIHEQIVARGYGREIFLETCLVDMYAKCGSVEDALGVFNKMETRDVICWNAMIGGCVRCGEGQKALELFRQMQHEQVDPQLVTFVGVLNACASVGRLGEGKHIHEEVIRRGYISDLAIGNSLIDMYAKCGSVEDARRVFQEMSTRDVVSWNAMIAGYVNCGRGQKALGLYRQMQQEEVDPNSVTYVAVLNACASVVALEEGRYIHKEIVRTGHEADVFVGSCLVDMYAKCGSIDDAERVFNVMPTRDLVSWNTMLAGYAIHGCAKKVVEHFEQMCNAAKGVNGITLVSLLYGCSHGGLVAEGLQYFESISSLYKISPTGEHFACIVDLLARAGRLHEAEDLIKGMHFEPHAALWKSLLGGCRIHGNVEMGERVAKQVLKCDPEDAAGYVMLSNIYAAAGRWDRSATED